MGRYLIEAPYLGRWIYVTDPSEPYYGYCEAVSSMREATIMNKRTVDRYMSSVELDHAPKRKVVST